MRSYRDFDSDAAAALRRSVREGQRAAHRAIDRLADESADWRDAPAPVIDRLAERAGDAMRLGAMWARDGGDRVRRRVVDMSDRTVHYVRDDPVRAVLMAAAVGTVLVAVVRLLSARRNR
jgi:ElaB/YqjD/DUF883 family membrane-anchored ribosome-binding protein